MNTFRKCVHICVTRTTHCWMYPTELEIKATTESNTSSSYFDLLLLIEQSAGHFFMIKVMISTSISHTVRSWVAISHLRQPMSFLSRIPYSKIGRVPLMTFIHRAVRLLSNLLGQGTSGNVYFCLLGSSMVDMGMSSSNIMYASPKDTFHSEAWPYIVITSIDRTFH